MKIVPLLFACVALANFAKVGAMNNNDESGLSGGAPLESRRTATPNPHPESSSANNSNPHPDIGPWAAHTHTHAPGIQRPIPNDPSRPRKLIQIGKVINGGLTDFHALQGELVPNPDIERCNSPYGHAIVELIKTKRLYACLQPFNKHKESVDRAHNHDPAVYLAVVKREGQRQLEGNLAPHGQRQALEAQGKTFHDILFRTVYRLNPQGIVYYTPLNGTKVEGILYQYPGYRLDFFA
ncbi:uncharacterized protein LOC117171436 [Belonocnema kinseyi]|uniref:uncharacterized protein LOC117171436 n=1 Tax=Belonocnema kinseyi TaxID=2817044 RepID=UPI00143E023A|nr:uncharacterized protein LOC117171436 [Belonocnema kinseyi]